MSTSLKIVGLGVAAAGAFAQGTVNLAGTANAEGIISEDAIIGGFGQISQGDGGPGDADAFYLPDGTPIGSGIDLFPNETSFGVGSLAFDDAGLTGVGIETRSVSSIDLGLLFTASSATSDISGQALELLFFGTTVGFNFGPIGVEDTVTFTDGELTSIDLEIAAEFEVDLQQPTGPTVYSGTFSITGNEFALSIEDTAFGVDLGFFVVDSTLTVDITGTVDAVVPAPAGGVAVALAGLCAARRRRA